MRALALVLGLGAVGVLLLTLDFRPLAQLSLPQPHVVRVANATSVLSAQLQLLQKQLSQLRQLPSSSAALVRLEAGQKQLLQGQAQLRQRLAATEAGLQQRMSRGPEPKRQPPAPQPQQPLPEQEQEHEEQEQEQEQEQEPQPQAPAAPAAQPGDGSAAFLSWVWTAKWAANCSSALAGAGGNASRLVGLDQLCQLPDVWRNCSGLYLDIGTNVGVQIRKVYHAYQFPGAPVLPLFDAHFGTARSKVCALGVEANPAHTGYLATLNAFFAAKGLPALILTGVAASSRPGTATFHRDIGSPVEWGASLAAGHWQLGRNRTDYKVTVPLLDLPAFVMDVVRPMRQQHELQHGGQRLPTVMKLDVEGEEYGLVPGLMLSGALCEIDLTFAEVHDEQFRNDRGIAMPVREMVKAFDRLRPVFAPRCDAAVSELDDETFLDGMAVPLPR